MSICRSVSDSKAREICQELTRRHPLTLKDFDQGTEEIRFDGPQPTLKKVGASDGKISSQEVYQKAIEVAERNKTFLNFLRGRFEIPWIEESALLKARVVGRVQKIKANLTQTQPHLKGFDFQSDMARRLFSWMIQPEEEGGLGLRADFSAKGPQRTLSDVYRERRASCIDFVNLFLFAAKMAAIPAVPLQIYQNSSGSILNHTGIGIKNQKTGRIEFIADISLNYFGKPIEGEVWSPVSRLEFLSDYYTSKGGRTPDPALAERLIDLGLQLSPQNFLILLHKAYYLYLRKENSQAKKYLLESISVNPKYPDAYWNLHVLANETGDEKLSSWALGQFQTLTPEKTQ